jgi:quercetin dioxygenase-like cupin family protein
MINRRDAIGSLMMMMAAGAAAEGRESAPAWPDAVFTLETGKTTHDSFGDTTIYFDGKTGQLKGMTAGTLLLKPGQEPHPPHQHPEEEFMFVAEGTGEITLHNDVHNQVTKVGPGAMMFCEGNRLHGIKNTGSTPMRFYFCKWLGSEAV